MKLYVLIVDMLTYLIPPVSSKSVILKYYIPIYGCIKYIIHLKYYKYKHCNKLITKEIPFRVKNLHITYRLLYAIKNHIFDCTRNV